MSSDPKSITPPIIELIDFDEHAFDIMSENFIHDDMLKVKANVSNSRGFINLEETVTQEKGGELNMAGQANMTMPLHADKTMSVKLSSNQLTLQVNNGIVRRGVDQEFKFYAKWQTSRKLENNLFGLGCDANVGNAKLDYELDYSKELNVLRAFSTFSYHYKNWKIEKFGVFNWNKMAVLMNNLLIGTQKGANVYNLRIEHQNWQNKKSIFDSQFHIKDYVDNIHLNVTRVVSPLQKLGAEVTFNNEFKYQNASLAFQTMNLSLNNALKLKASSDRSVAVSLKNSLGSYGNYILGIGVNDIGDKNQFKFGCELSLNL